LSSGDDLCGGELEEVAGFSTWQLEVVMRVGSSQTKLIVVRGNSGSGKSAIAAELRERYGRGVAIVSQDNLRRVVLRDRDRRGAANIGLIGLTARYALDHGFHVVVEGIMYSDRYSEMLLGLCQDHVGGSHLYYIDLPLAETLRRHATKPNAEEFGEAEMTEWYLPRDLLPGDVENIIGAESTLEDSVQRIVDETRLLTEQVPEHASL
jgi:predicted kinase